MSKWATVCGLLLFVLSFLFLYLLSINYVTFYINYLIVVIILYKSDLLVSSEIRLSQLSSWKSEEDLTSCVEYNSCNIDMASFSSISHS